jgi:CBS domain-containing protein
MKHIIFIAGKIRKEDRMKVTEVMSKNVVSVKKESSILDVIKLMREKNVGFIIIEEDSSPIGVITDRDIVISLSKELSTSTPIIKIRKKYVITIKEDKEISEASDLMGYMQVRRLVVVNEMNKLVGVLSVTDLLKHQITEEFALEAMIEISYNLSTNSEEHTEIFQTNAYIF